MAKLNVVITSGGTREYIDDVRVLSNISSGRLGAKIANVFIDHGHHVTYVAPKNAIHPNTSDDSLADIIHVTDTKSVMEKMQDLVPSAHVVIQAMAVSDFTFELEGSVKLSSGDPEAFIEHMRKTIVKTPKIISHFRSWNPKAILVGFKFTVGKSKDELIEIGKKLMHDNELDMVLANDKVQMQTRGDHVGILLMHDWDARLNNKTEIATSIYDNVIRLAPQKYPKNEE